MIQILTNRRRLNFATAHILSPGLQIEQYHIRSDENIVGIFGETEVSES